VRNHDANPLGFPLSVLKRDVRDVKKLPLRIPIRWRWSVLVSFTVTLAIIVLFFIIIDIEHDAWLENQAAQAKLQVERLTDELKLPLLSGSSTETGIAVQGFLDKVPTVLGVVIRFHDGSVKSFGPVQLDDAVLKILTRNSTVMRLPLKQLWYAKTAVYAHTVMGTIIVRFSGKQWERIADKLGQKFTIAAVVSVLLSGVMVFLIAGRMSRPIEMLSEAALKVAEGDYQIDLPVHGNDELSDALSQFNVMAHELAHKEELRRVFGRYLNPKLINEVFESGDVQMESHRQEVSVLFADMVSFTSFSESTQTEEVVRLLNRHFEVFHRVITYYGGHVDKYIGDAVMAVFNHPVSEVKHVRHAALAGLAMNTACQKMGIKRPDGDPVSFRFGLNCGQAIVGNVGAARRLEYTVIGDAVNVASRMSGLGSGCELVMSRKTFALLGEDFDFQSIGVRKVKGISKKLETGYAMISSPQLRQEIEHVVDLAFNPRSDIDMWRMPQPFDSSDIPENHASPTR